VALSPQELKARIERASREGRFQQALELAKQLHKAEPTAAAEQLLKNTYLGRARQLRGQGMVKDAISVLQFAAQMGDGPPGWLKEVADELSLCGKGQEALALARQAGGDPQIEAKLLGQSVDQAIRQEAKGRAQVPPEWQDDFDRVLSAFAQVEAAQDDRARDTLQAIGLRSPFLEWKLFLRGLIAYYQGDDGRALENWQRLAPARLPARLAAPYRLTIDPAFQQAQGPKEQAALRKIADELLGQGLVVQMRSIQKNLSNEKHEDAVSRALRQAEALLPVLRQLYPRALPRLAACFYWALVTDGEPRDVPLYERLFGAPRDDPRFDRLRAMVLEQYGAMRDAHKAWQNFEKTVAENPANWPGPQANHARALIWLRMANNAMNIEGIGDEDLPAGMREHHNRSGELHPSASECLERSMKLAPDLLEAHRVLFHYHIACKRLAQAQKAAEQLLERFPNDLATLVELGALLKEKEKHIEAVAVFERALRINPLDRRLRTTLGNAYVFAARSHAEADRFDQARSCYQAALAYRDSTRDNSVVYCKWAACEFKAGNETRAEELLRQALETGSNRLAVNFSMLVEVIRLKLPRKLKSRFDRSFKEAMAEPPTAEAAVAVAETVAAHGAAGITYTGRKTHEKHVIAYLERAGNVPFAEEQLESLCASLLVIKSTRVFNRFITMAKRKFPKTPFFPFCEADALARQPAHRRQAWRIQSLLEHALQLARERPSDEKQKELVKNINEKLEETYRWNPFSRLFSTRGGGPFGNFMGDPDFADAGDFDDEDDEGW
jgi:tetratricopeptide (TPR) repeat protein